MVLATICRRPVTLTFDLLTLKSVWESYVTWGTPVQSFVFLGLLVFELEPMYATSDRRTDRQTDGRRTPITALCPLGGGIIINSGDSTQPCITPEIVINHSEKSPSTRTVLMVSLYSASNSLTILKHLKYRSVYYKLGVIHSRNWRIF